MDFTFSIGNMIAVAVFIISFLALAWKVVDSLIKRNEDAKERTLNRELKSKDKMMDRELEHNKELERQKIELGKELERQKQRHVQVLIDGIKTEIGKIDTKLGKVHDSYIKLNVKFESNADECAVIMEEVQSYFKITKARFEIIEKQMNSNTAGVEGFKTKLIKINNDLIMVKNVANKLRTKS